MTQELILHQPENLVILLFLIAQQTQFLIDYLLALNNGKSQLCVVISWPGPAADGFEAEQELR